MNSKVFLIIFISCLAKLNFCFGQVSDSTLIVGKSSYLLIPDNLIRAELTESLKGFLKARNDYSKPNPYIDSAYLKTNFEPFQWLRDAEGRLPNGKNFFTPTLLALLPITEQKYIVKLAYIGVKVEDELTPMLNLIATIEARKVNGRYYFYNALDYNTRNFNITRVGNIKYIYPNKLDLVKAKAMDNFNSAFAKKLNTKPISITYYKCDDPEQLFKMLGYDYIGNMYYSMAGGLAEWWTNTLYAGNNSELYEHEVIHFYTAKLFEHSTRIVDEGYATYIGGSGGVVLEKLAAFAKNYINQNPKDDLLGLATDFKVRVDHGVPITYILSALVCKDIEEKFGVSGIKKLFSPQPQEDYFDTLKRVNGIGRVDFNDYIKVLLAKN